jgi:hypothetical protein
MAIMYPREIDSREDVTDGERRVFRFLQASAKPDRDFAGFYEPYLGAAGHAPDFILLGRDLGALVIEVKDWALSQIKAADQHQFVIQSAGETKTRTNPDKQARGYVHGLMEWLREVPGLTSKKPGFEGKLKVPIGRMVAFPNIKRSEYLDAGSLSHIIPPERIIFQEDLDPGGALIADSSGLALRQRISPILPFQAEPLTPKEFHKLNDLLYPEVIQLPPRAGIGKHQLHRQIQALDEAQAQLARRLGRGHQIIKGPPGSGKTLVLVHRCFQLRNYHPQIRRILVVCFNIAFASYLKRLLLEKGVGLGEDGVQVFHFFELCAAVMGDRVDFDHQDSDYYQLVVEETLDTLGEGKSRLEPFDAVLVDEGQDLNNDMLKVILGLLKPEGDLIMALDAYQDLYRRDSSWRSVGIEAQGRTHYLGKIYRNTFEILTFSQRFIRAVPVAKRQPGLPLDDEFHGEPPKIVRFQNVNEIVAFLAADVQKEIAGGEYKRSEICIIYDDKTYSPEAFAYDSRDLPHRLKKCLEKAGIPVKWVSEDVRSKEMFDITTDSVSLLSIHSSKGLDFDLVYLIGADNIAPSEETRDYLSGLLYVALTRAKHRLVVPYVEESEFIARMRSCLR